MTNYNDQVLDAWDEWEGETGERAGNPDNFVSWALEKGKLALGPQDVTKLLRKRVTTALRQATRIDDDGIIYRAKQCVIEFENGGQIPLWFDTDKGGTPNLRQKAVRQRRDAIANGVYRAMCDVEHMNKKHGENIQFVLDFTDDYHERKAANSGQQENDEEVA